MTLLPHRRDARGLARPRHATPLAALTAVVPTRNREALLRRTVTAVLAQVDVDVEVVVVDEGSSDGTRAWLHALDDERLRVVRHDRPRGVAEARNAGLALVTSPWVAFTDDDDLWAPGKLAAQVAALAADPEAGWSCTGSVIVGPSLAVEDVDLPPTRGSALAALLGRNAVPGGGSSVVARTELVRAVGGFDPELRNLADWDLWIRLAMASPLAPVPRPLVAYLRHGGGLSRGLDDFRAELAHVSSKYQTAREVMEVGLDEWNWGHWVAEQHVRSGRRGAAARHYLQLARTGNRSSYARAALLGAWPGAQRLRDARRRRRAPDGYLAEAEGWLSPLRSSV